VAEIIILNGMQTNTTQHRPTPKSIKWNYLWSTSLEYWRIRKFLENLFREPIVVKIFRFRFGPIYTNQIVTIVVA